jgi:hypothetical protein
MLTEDGRETTSDDRDDVEERQTLLDFVPLVPCRDDVDESREEAGLEDSQKNAADAELNPIRDKTHSKLCSTPTNNANCQVKSSAEVSEGDVARNLAMEVWV